MKYEQIIIGAGAAGLYYAAHCPCKNGLILEKMPSPGQKLLLSGSGQCNLTHGGSIKDFISHYGEQGPRIRSALYRGNNLLLMKFFTENGIPLTERSDGKVFPRSMDASKVLELLLSLSRKNGWELKTDCPVTALETAEDGFSVNGAFEAPRVIVAAGGCSYPATGSDGSMFPLLQKLGFELSPLKPSLVPLKTEDYPYGALSGISFPGALVQVDSHKLSGGLLLTHDSFSGPAVLNLSRYAKAGSTLKINYNPQVSNDIASEGDRRKALTFFSDEWELPKRFVRTVLKRLHIDPDAKISSLAGREKKAAASLLGCDTFSISGTSGFKSAMATSGGICLDEVDLKTFVSKKYPGLFIIGEALDIDGDTGGYNLQFAFSSGYCAAKCVL